MLSQVFGIEAEVWTEDLQRERVQIYFNDVIFIKVEKTRPILFLFKINFTTFLDPDISIRQMFNETNCRTKVYRHQLLSSFMKLYFTTAIYFLICLFLISELCLTLKTKAISVLWHGYRSVLNRNHVRFKTTCWSLEILV